MLRTFYYLFTVIFLSSYIYAITPNLNGSIVMGEYDSYQVAIGQVNTTFGDNNDSAPDTANGGELDSLSIADDSGNLYLAIAGNIATDWSKLVIFLDVDGDINTGAVDPVGTSLEGGQFPLGFELAIRFDSGAWPGPGISIYSQIASYDSGGLLIANNFAGGIGLAQGSSGGGTLSGAGPILGAFRNIRVYLNNSNIAGVSAWSSSNSAAAAGVASAVATGLEIALPRDLIEAAIGGNVGSEIGVYVTYNTAGGDFGEYISNQTLPSLPGYPGWDAGDPAELSAQSCVKYSPSSLPTTDYNATPYQPSLTIKEADFLDTFDRSDIGDQWSNTGGTWNLTGDETLIGNSIGTSGWIIQASDYITQEEHVFEYNVRSLQAGTSGTSRYGAFVGYSTSNPDAVNYLAVFVDTINNQLQSYVLQEGEDKGWVNSSTLSYNWNDWHTIKIDNRDGKIDIYIDSALVITRRANVGSGQCGFVLEDAKAEFGHCALSHYTSMAQSEWDNVDHFSEPIIDTTSWTNQDGGDWGIWQSKDMYGNSNGAAGWSKQVYSTVSDDNYIGEVILKSVGEGIIGGASRLGIATSYDTATDSFFAAWIQTRVTNPRIVTWAKANGIDQGWLDSIDLDSSVDLSKWHALRVEKRGSDFKVLFDGEVMVQRTINNMPGGKMACMVEDHHADFGRFRFRNLPVRVDHDFVEDFNDTLASNWFASHSENTNWGIWNSELLWGDAVGNADWARYVCAERTTNDYRVDCRVKISGTQGSTYRPRYGIVTSLEDEGQNYFIAWIDILDKLVSTYAKDNSVDMGWQDSAALAGNPNLYGYHKLSVEKIGDQFTVYFDDAIVLTRTVDIPGGRIAVILEDAHADFDEITVDNFGGGTDESEYVFKRVGDIGSLDEGLSIPAGGGGWMNEYVANASFIQYTDPIDGVEKMYCFARGTAGGPTTCAIGVLTQPISTFNPQGPWDDYAGNPVISPSTSYDAHDVLDTCAVVGASNDIYVYYAGKYDGNAYLCGAVSTDGGYTFTKFASNPLIEHVGPTSAVYHNGQYYIFYASSQWDPVNQVSNDKMRIWVAVTSNPQDLSSAQHYICVSPGTGSWDYNAVGGGRVFRLGDKWYMIYQGDDVHFDFDPRFHAAVSDDLIHWRKIVNDKPMFLRGQSGNWDQGAIWWGETLQWDGSLYMLYEGWGSHGYEADRETSYYSGGKSQLGLASCSTRKFLEWSESEENVLNLSIIYTNWLDPEPGQSADLNHDGIVNYFDFAIFVSR